MNKKPILIVGLPRSGTSICTRIIQGHIGEFPFKINRYAEPEELITIHERWLARFNYPYKEKFYFPNAVQDLELIKDLSNFFWAYKDKPCIIKDPLLTVSLNNMKFRHAFWRVLIRRDRESVIESWEYHKKMKREDAEKKHDWFADNSVSGNNYIYFSRNKEQMINYLKGIVKMFDIIWDQKIFDKHWDEGQIEYYKLSKKKKL